MVLLLQYTLIFSSVLILVALGGCFAEHSGVINLGLEGIMVLETNSAFAPLFLSRLEISRKVASLYSSRP